MVDTNLGANSERIYEADQKEDFEKRWPLIKKYVMTDVEDSTKHVFPFVLSSCKKNGKVFRGFSIMKLIKGFRKVSKELKKIET